MKAYGRGEEQNYPEALAIFQSCHARGAHAGCALYAGTMHASGQGTPVDYEAARVYLQQAAESRDVRFVSEAHEAFARLDGLMKRSEEETRRVLSDLAEGLAKRPDHEDGLRGDRGRKGAGDERQGPSNAAAGGERGAGGGGKRFVMAHETEL